MGIVFQPTRGSNSHHSFVRLIGDLFSAGVILQEWNYIQFAIVSETRQFIIYNRNRVIFQEKINFIKS